MLVVEPARAGDVSSVVALAGEGLAMDPIQMSGAIAAGCCMVARDVPTDRIVGFALARREMPCDGHILALAVDHMHRGEGIGRALLGGVRHEMLRAGAMRLSLEVRADNERAQAFYVRNGFHPEGLESHAYGDGMDAVRYARSI